MRERVEAGADEAGGSGLGETPAAEDAGPAAENTASGPEENSPATEESCSIERISPTELPPSSSILQSPLWAELKGNFGWSPYAFTVEGKEPLLLLVRRFPLGRSIAYVPHGLKGWASKGEGEVYRRLAALSRSLAKHLPPGTLFIRYDIPWEMGAEETFETPLPLRKAPYDIQPPSTVELSLEAGEEELLAQMKRKTRYNIRLAAKKGVLTRIYTAAEALGRPASGGDPLSRWYRLYEETAERDGIAIHSQDYYRRLFELVAEGGDTEGAPAPELYLITAEHEGDLLAGIVVSVYGGTATYMYGAGSNHKRNLMGSYAVQWEAMGLAKQRGALCYDLFGIPPADDPSHPMHGLYRFKTGFGGRIVHRPGCIDYPLSNLGYPIYRGLEKLRYLYFKRLKKRR